MAFLRNVSRGAGALALLGLLTLGGQVKASIIPTLASHTANGDGTYTFSYSASIAADQTASTGDFLTLYDFAGLVPGSVVTPTGWAASVQNVGVTPPSVLPTDDPNVPNITLTRTGASLAGPTTFSFSARSTLGNVGSASFAARASRSSGSLAGSKLENVGLYEVPTGSAGITAVETPEPASLALLFVGVPIALYMVRRERRRPR